MQDLTGKVALVTGGSRGIGAAIAIKLAQAGADVAITYVTSSEKAQAVVAQLQSHGRRAVAYKADSADAIQVQIAVERTVGELGRIDVLVNNAGIFVAGELATMTLDQYERIMDVNVRAAFAATQAALRHMADGSRIINIGSCLAERTAHSGMSLYSASKAALVGLTKGMARDLGRRGITVNVVHPGPIDTDMNPADHERAQDTLDLLALPHYGHVDDVAGMVAFLAGPGGRYVTGTAVSVDGGYAA